MPLEKPQGHRELLKLAVRTGGAPGTVMLEDEDTGCMEVGVSKYLTLTTKGACALVLSTRKSNKAENYRACKLC